MDPQTSRAAGIDPDRRVSPVRFDPEPWRTELLVFARRMGAAARAEDVVQETFLRALERPPRSQPRAYLFRVALSAIRDLERDDRRSRVAHVRRRPASDEAPEPGPLDAAANREMAGVAWRVVERLPARPRAALLMRIQHHMDYDEIAAALECSVATARQHFHLGVKAVRDAIAEREHE